jgi:hypothetical protein
MRASGGMVLDVAERTGVVLTLEKWIPLGSLTRNALDVQISVRPQG